MKVNDTYTVYIIIFQYWEGAAIIRTLPEYRAKPWPGQSMTC